jgi:hypothetical protein
MEILISFSILVPVALVVIGLFPAAHAITQRGWALTNAQHLAETELEKARCQNFDSLAGETVSLTQRGMTFQVVTQVLLVDNNSKTVSCQVTWQFQQAQTFQVSSQIVRMASSS